MPFRPNPTFWRILLEIKLIRLDNMIEFIQKKGRKAIVLFVHGFTGGNETWQNASEEYFPEMLLQNEKIADFFDFAYFTYFTELLPKKKHKRRLKLIRAIFPKLTEPVRSNVSIEDLGELLGSQIRYQLKDYSNIIIVAHSMGGLISKYYILTELKESSTPSVKLFISLAVPHAGSEFSTFGKLIIDNVQISDLNPLSNILRYLNHSWITTPGVPLSKYFYGQYDDVVPKNSALPVTKIDEGIPCECDHVSICKPETKESFIFKAIEQSLIDCVSDAILIDVLTIKSIDGPADKYLDELFVLKLLVADIHNVTVNNAKTLFYNAEFARKLYSNEADYHKLNELYVKIEDIYQYQFTRLIAGNIKNSHELVAEVYKKIEDHDVQILASSLPYIQALHKKGMIHHLANMAEKQVWWDKDQSAESLKAYMDSKCKQ